MTGMSHDEITKRIQDHANWLLSIRVSQDGWDLVMQRNQQDTQSLANALREGKIIAHQLTYRKFHDEKEDTKRLPAISNR